MVIHTHIIILKEIKTSPLEKIQLLLSEHIMKAYMVSKYIYMNNKQVVSLALKCKHHCFKLEVMSWINFLMHLKLSRSIIYNLISLHKHTTKANNASQ